MYGSSNPRPHTSQVQMRGGVDLLTLDATLQLDDRSANMLALDPNGADREVRMPASDREGVPFTIVNVGGANNILLRDSVGGAVDGFGPAGGLSILTPGQSAVVVNIGGTWGHFGVVTGAL